MHNLLKHKLNSVPSKPGVYCWLDAHGHILYVGKAKNLKKRVSQYFRTDSLDQKTSVLMSKVVDFSVTVTENEHQALLLESDLIKQHHPRYNILLRDDKSYPYIFLSTEHRFPRLGYSRNKKREKGRYFGPYPDAGSVRDNLALIQKLFQLRRCADISFSHRTRPCLQYQINRCTAPCVNYVTEKQYRTQVNDAILFLEGKDTEVIREIMARMTQSSEKLEFESAARDRDTLMRLRQLQRTSSDPIEKVLLRNLHKKNQLESLQSVLQTPNKIKRIECFDISHTSGQLTKASCVVFDAYGPVKKSYRQFNITGITPGDDYAAMKQVLTRRYTRLSVLPDLIIVDGGKGQLQKAICVLKGLKISDAIVMGVAKGPARKAGLEKLFIAGHKQFIQLPSNHPALLLIQAIRDEAHRFAITAHRKKRAKQLLQSRLDQIAGIGKKRRLMLLTHFGGYAELKKASIAEIKLVKGISQSLAERIHNELHRE